MPYWDSTIESHLPNPSDSSIFTRKFMGETNSKKDVADGPFAGWITNQVSAKLRNLRFLRKMFIKFARKKKSKNGFKTRKFNFNFQTFRAKNFPEKYEVLAPHRFMTKSLY